MKFKKHVCLEMCCFILCLFSSCAKNSSMPSKDEVQVFFDDNCGAIMAINDYIRNSDYQYVLITNYNGDLYFNIDKDRNCALPDSISAALNKLMHDRKISIAYLDHNMTIEYEIWYDSHDRGCGFCYVFNDQQVPNIQYLSYYEQLLKEGWYYYTTDYNLTR